MTAPATHLFRLARWGITLARRRALVGIEEDPNAPAPVRRLARLARLATEQLGRRGVAVPQTFDAGAACDLFKDRCSTVVELADWLEMFFVKVTPSAADVATHLHGAVLPALRGLRDLLAEIAVWDKASIAQAMKQTLGAHGLKMPQLAPAVRVLTCGRAQTPSIDAVLSLFDRMTVLERLQHV